MTDVRDFERQLDDWFVGEDPGRAPDRLLVSAMDRVGTIGQRRPIRSRRLARAPHTAWQRALALALIVLATVLAALLVSGALQRDPPRPLANPDLVVVREGRIVAIAMDGTERELGHVPDALAVNGGSLIINAGISPDGHLMINRVKDDQTAGLIVYDLRHPDAPPTEPDVQGNSYGFAPDGTIGLVTADGIATYDPLSGLSHSTPMTFEEFNPVDRPLTPGGGVQWAADGSGILVETGRFTIDADGKVTTATIGRLRPDGSFTPGAVPAFDDGMLARRIGPSGEILRCRREADDTCSFESGRLWAVTDVTATSVWTNPDPSTRITDFSWAIDGGLWVLIETAAEGPRNVSLVHVSPTDEVRTVASFPAEADDPDPNSYVASAVFAAIAPDDSRLVVYVNEPGDRRVPYLIDTTGGSPTRINREIAGWLTPGAIEATRPDVTPIPATDPTVRGLWTDGRTTLRLGSTRLTVDETSAFAIEAAGRDSLAIRGSGHGASCSDEPGLYRWSVDVGMLTLAAIEEPCPARASLLDGPYEASVPITGGATSMIEAGSRLRSAIVGVPLSLTVPVSGPASLERHVAQDLTLVGPVDSYLTADPGVVSVYVPTGAAVDPCTTDGDIAALAAGTDGVIAYIDGLDDLGIQRSAITETTFAGLPTITFDLSFDQEQCIGILFPADSNSGSGPLGKDPRLTVMQYPDGPVIVIAVGGGFGPDTTGRAWAEELAASISFGPLE